MKFKLFCVFTSTIVAFVATASFASPKKAEHMQRTAIKDDIDSVSLLPEATTVTPGVEALAVNPSMPLIIEDRSNASQSVQIAAASPNVPLAVVQDFDHGFSPVVEGTQVVHDFIVQNKGNAALIIEKVKTD